MKPAKVLVPCNPVCIHMYLPTHVYFYYLRNNSNLLLLGKTLELCPTVNMVLLQQQKKISMFDAFDLIAGSAYFAVGVDFFTRMKIWRF